MKTLTPQQLVELEILEARFGHQVGAALSESSAQLPGDILSRLNFAHDQALRHRKRPAPAPAFAPAILAAGGSAALAGGPAPSRWWSLASLLPLIALVCGLILIQEWHSDLRVKETAEIDLDLLADDLPPAAYADPAFLLYLKASRQ